MKEDSKKVYLGDGAYADFDGYGIILTTEDGISIQNTIYLEPEVLNSLLKYTHSLSTEGKSNEN